MKTTLPRKAVADALALASATIGRSQLPILGCVIIEASGGRVRFRTTDIDRHTEICIAGEGEGRILTPFKKLRQFLIASKSEDVMLEFIPKIEGTETEPGVPEAVRVQIGASAIMAESYPVDDFVPLPEMENAIKFTISGETLAAALRLTAYAQSTDDSRYVLNGVCLQHTVKDQKTLMIATDGRRLAMSSFKLMTEPTVNIDVIIPDSVIDFLSKNVKRFPATIGVKISLGEQRRISFDLGEIKVTSLLIDGQFPNFRQVIPTDGALWNFSVDRLKAIEALKAAIIKSHKENSMVFQFENHGLTLTHSDGTNRTQSFVSYIGGYYAKEKVWYERVTGEKGNKRVKRTSPAPTKFRTAFNPTYIVEALQSLSCTRATLCFVDELTPMRIQSDSDAPHSVVIMPMRTA